MNRGQTARVQASSRTVLLLKKANGIDDPTQAHESQLTFQLPAHTVRIEHYSSASLPADLHEWAFALVRDSLKELYIPVWGWRDEDKRKQLKAPTSRFLVAWASPSQQQDTPTQMDASPCSSTAQHPSAGGGAAAAIGTQDDRQQQRDSGHAPAAAELLGAATQPMMAAATVSQSGPQPQPAGGSKDQQSGDVVVGSGDQAAAAAGGLVPAAYLNYRFEQGYNKEPVLYVYEVMVSPGWQRLGLASRLMKLAEDMAWEAGMERVVLTVLLANSAAEGLYRAISYTEDKASPHASKGYHILSRGPPKEPASATKKNKKK